MPRKFLAFDIETAADIPGIDFHTFSGADVVRHPLVQKIIEAYDAYRNPVGAAGANA